MKSIIKIQDLPETLDMEELMEVKGGYVEEIAICVFTAAVKCTVPGSGVVVQGPTTSTGSTLQTGTSGPGTLAK